MAMMTRTDIKRHLGFTPNFKKQKTEEERLLIMADLIARTEHDLQMYKDMVAERDLY